MGVKQFDKVYVLFHIRKFKEVECLFDHECGKLIGTFYSKDKALKVVESYKVLEGFRDYPECFRVEEYLLNEINNSKLKDLFENEKKGKYTDIK